MSTTLFETWVGTARNLISPLMQFCHQEETQPGLKAGCYFITLKTEATSQEPAPSSPVPSTQQVLSTYESTRRRCVNCRVVGPSRSWEREMQPPTARHWPGSSQDNLVPIGRLLNIHFTEQHQKRPLCDSEMKGKD